MIQTQKQTRKDKKGQALSLRSFPCSYSPTGSQTKHCTESGSYSAICMGFPHSSVGKEYTCNAGDPGLIPGLGRSAGEGIGYPLQCSWVSLMAQLVKNLPTMWETWV